MDYSVKVVGKGELAKNVFHKGESQENLKRRCLVFLIATTPTPPSNDWSLKVRDQHPHIIHLGFSVLVEVTVIPHF